MSMPPPVLLMKDDGARLVRETEFFFDSGNRGLERLG